jgi:hypothetical protein
MSDQQQRDAAGLADVVRSVGVLAKHARELVEQTGGVIERELAMVLTTTEDVRDRVMSKEALEKARQQTLLNSLRQDAHRAVNLAFDAAATVYVFGVDIVERVLDRPPAAGTASVQANA